VAPVSRGAIVWGKVLGGASLAWFQGALILVLAPMAGISPTPASFIEALGILGLLAVALTSTGFAFAWKIDSTQGYHAVMNVLLIPMWFLSGAFFPVSTSPAWLHWVMRLNPLTYGTAAFRRALYGQRFSGSGDLPPLQTGLAVLVVWCFVALAADVFFLERSASR